MVRVKAFSENISFFGNAIFLEGKCIQVFSCVGIRFTENQFWCLVCTNILRKMTSVLRKINSHVCFRQTFYGKWNSFFTKINSHVWFVDHFTKNNNFKHLHYLNKPVIVQKYSSKFKHLHCLNTSITVQKYPSTSTSKIIIWIYP